MGLDATVGLARSGDRRGNVFAALDRVRDSVEPKVRSQVMLKPNFLSSEKQLASTHVDAVRGAIDFLLSTPRPPEEIVVAEGANESYSGEAFDNFGYRSLAREYPVAIRLVDLNQETRWRETSGVTAAGRLVPVRMPLTVLECPCIISVAVAKTHDCCVVTLAQKNLIMGTLKKEDRIAIHGFESHAERELPLEAQRVTVNLTRVSRHLRADVGVIDGTVGMQGNGPGGGFELDLGIAVASGDVFAADAVMAGAMGFEPLEIGLLSYADAEGLGVADLRRIRVVGPPLDAVRTRIRAHDTVDLQLQWQDSRAEEFLAAR